MIIDILSDLHLDAYFGKKVKESAVKLQFSNIFNKEDAGDILVIAGDLGHNNKQNIQILKLIRKIYGYKNIICVLGNHDYHLINSQDRENHKHDSHLRAKRMRDTINHEEGLVCLDGNTIEINGIIFGGCDSWYDGEYIKKNFTKTCPLWNIPKDSYYINQLWENSIIDANYIYNIEWMKKAKEEKEKIEKIYKDIDIMITHVNPSIRKEHTSSFYRESETTGFFTFNGEKYLKEGSMKYWIHGHTHDVTGYEMHKVKCICNPLGYPSGGNRKIRKVEYNRKKKGGSKK